MPMFHQATTISVSWVSSCFPSNPQMADPAPLVHSMDADLSEKHLVTACSDGSVRLYNIKENDLEQLAVLEGHTGPVTKALYTHFGELIVSSDFTGKLMIWKAVDGKYTKCFEKQVVNGPVYDIAVRYSEDGITVFCGCVNGVLVTLKINSNFECKESKEEVHRFGIPALSANSECLVTVGFDCETVVFLEEEKIRLKHHSARISTVSLAPSNVFKRLVFASGDEDGKLVVAEMKDGEFGTQEFNLGKPCHSTSWSRSGFVLTVGFGDDEFKSFSITESGECTEIQMEKIEK